MNKEIVIVIHEPSLSGANIGLLEILTVLSKNYNFIIVAPSFGKLISCILHLKPDSTIIIKDYRWWMHFEKTRFNILFTIKQRIKNIIAIRDIYLILRKRKVELIFSNTIVINIGAVLARKLEKPHYWYLHEFGKLDHDFNFLYGEKNSRKQMKKIGGNVFANSKITSVYFSTWLDKSIDFLYYPVIVNEKPNPVVKKLDKISFLILGRINVRKGHMFALQAIRELDHSLNKSIELTIMGNCDDDQYLLVLEEFVKKHKLEQIVRFLPHEADPFKIVNKHDIVLNFSENEAFGRMNIEAMKLGKILVSTNRGSSSELITHGYNGFIFNHNNLTEFINLIDEIGQLSDFEISKISSNAINYSNNKFNYTQSLDKINAIIKI